MTESNTPNTVTTTPTTVTENPINPVNSPTPQTTVSTAIDYGVKTALIGAVINILITLLLVSTFGIIGSGIYLGISKKGKYTYPIFWVISMIFFILTDFVKNGLDDPDPARGLFVLFFGSFLMAVFPLGVAWVTRKIAKK